MRLPKLEKGIFLRRLNRFVGEVDREGKKELVHIANTGRLEKLLIEGNIAYLLPLINRKLRYRLFAVEDRGHIVVVDSFIGERLLEEEWKRGEDFPFMGRVKSWRRAPRFEGMQLDYLVEADKGVFLIEQKSSTLLEGDTAYFPDAPTQRGYRQLLALSRAEAKGFIPMLIMVIKHPLAQRFSFAHHIDEKFSQMAEEFVGRYPFLKLKLLLEEEELLLSPFCSPS